MTTTNINFDLTLHRLKERTEECGDFDEFCGNCEAAISEVDKRIDRCTQCEAKLDCGDESVDEDLWED